MELIIYTIYCLKLQFMFKKTDLINIGLIKNYSDYLSVPRVNRVNSRSGCAMMTAL